MRFAHIADTHIKNLKYHYEYKIVFDQIYEILRKENIDYIIHCGDIAHTKTQISPEFVEMCGDFFSNLAKIAPTYIILGNHDGNLKNSGRQDAITPIIKALDCDDLHLLKKSGETHLDDKFCLNVLSVFDEEGWIDPTDDSKVNIALYHGSINNCTTDVGWRMETGDHEIKIFENHDYAMLGDIHKCQRMDEDGRVWYAGSTVQQNFGEDDDKGFLIWDIQDKDKFDIRHVTVKNPKPFVTIQLTPKGNLPRSVQVSPDSRLRLVANNNISLDRVRKAIDVAKSKFKPESVTFLKRATDHDCTVEGMVDGSVVENLRDLKVQERLIKEYLKDYEPSKESAEKVLELNRKYNILIEEGEEVSRNIRWSLKSIEWDNLFNYGKGNKVNFEKLNGVVGVFGKNFSGKSSIIDSLLFTVFNSTSKNVRKNLNIINQNRNMGRGKAKIMIGDKVFSIERTSEKYVKKLKGEETLEAKTDLTVSSFDLATDVVENHNDLTRNDSDKNIRKILGTLEDFLLTSMSSQLGALTFINEGSTKRKEIMAKFLDLEIFEKKFKMAKEDAVDLRGVLKRLEGVDYEAEIKNARYNLEENNISTSRQKDQCTKLEGEIDIVQSEISFLNEKIDSIPAEIIDIAAVTKRIIKNEELIESIKEINVNINQNINFNQEKYEKIESFLESFDIEECQKKKEIIDEKSEQLKNLIAELTNKNEDKQRYTKKEKLLREVPCGSEFSHCKFIKDAYKAVNLIEESSIEIADLSIAIDKEGEELQDLNRDQVNEYINKYNQVLTKKNSIATELANDQINVEKNKAELVRQTVSLQDLRKKQQEYEENREAIENLEQLLKEKKTKNSQLKKIKLQLQRCNEEILELYKQHGSLEQQLDNLIAQEEELYEAREAYSAYDLYMRCTHPNGISYDIIKRQLPFINDEIAKCLANIVDFEIYFENDGKKLDIFIKHPKYEARPLELGSGAEKTIAAMAIRLALLSVSNLPKGDLFILDEPGTALDEENMEGFVRILELIKLRFKTVLLISHVDSLKDCADTQLVIDKKEGFAFINQ
jgi:DNA repair exonuclease SbcCD ATPase subunit/DNA repair exonuclease SbcCD nuclease subunit